MLGDLLRNWLRNPEGPEPPYHSAPRQLMSVEQVQMANAMIQNVQGRFEGHEAIYIEKGALRVRVSNINGSAEQRCIWAEIEEIITPRLACGFWFRSSTTRRAAFRHTIGAGFLTRFGPSAWHAGYGCWSMYFDPKVIASVVGLASEFPESCDRRDRYRRILDLVCQPNPSTPACRRIFPDVPGERSTLSPPSNGTTQ